MVHRKYTLIILLLFTGYFAQAQVITFAQADSTSNALYLSSNWQQLVVFGSRALQSGIDFPLLRQRIGYAQFVSGNYSAALLQFSRVLKDDSYNQTAGYYSYLAESYLNRGLASAYHAASLDTITQNTAHITPFGLVEAGVEAGVKATDESSRGNVSYTRLFLSNRLGWRVQLDQSVAYFHQAIATTQKATDLRPAVNTAINDQQVEYYARLSFALKNNWHIIGAYHYLSTQYSSTSYSSNVGLVGIKYLNPYFDTQLDFTTGNIINKNSYQYNGTLRLYPLGNLNFYTITRASLQQQDGINQAVFSQSVGFKVLRNVWLEGNATFGNLDNYADNDALYIYNAIDMTTQKESATLFYQLNNHALLFLNDTFERKQDTNKTINYNQNSITGGLTWKF